MFGKINADCSTHSKLPANKSEFDETIYGGFAIIIEWEVQCGKANICVPSTMLKRCSDNISRGKIKITLLQNAVDVAISWGEICVH